MLGHYFTKNVRAGGCQQRLKWGIDINVFSMDWMRKRTEVGIATKTLLQ